MYFIYFRIVLNKKISYNFLLIKQYSIFHLVVKCTILIILSLGVDQTITMRDSFNTILELDLCHLIFIALVSLSPSLQTLKQHSKYSISAVIYLWDLASCIWNLSVCVEHMCDVQTDKVWSALWRKYGKVECFLFIASVSHALDASLKTGCTMTRVLWTLVKRIMRSWRCEIWLDCSKQPPLMWSFCPIKAKRERTRSVFTLTSALSFEKWRLRVWLLELLICRLHVKVDHVSDFHGHCTKGEQIADKGGSFSIQ